MMDTHALKEKLALTNENVIVILKTIYDPEIPVDIWELGLIYNIHITEEKDLQLTMTLTSPMCPVAETLPNEIKEALVHYLVDAKEVQVEVTWEPQWDKSMMSEEAKLELGFFEA